jgi:hypothetical protein
VAAYPIAFCLHLGIDAAAAVAASMSKEDFSNCLCRCACLWLVLSFQRPIIGACADLQNPAQGFDLELLRRAFNELENWFQV